MKSGLRKLFNQGNGQNSTPISYSVPRRYQPPLSGRNDADITERTSSQSGTVYAIITLLARSTAKANWSLYKKTIDNRVRFTTRDAGTDDRPKFADNAHQALKVWHHPNDYMSRHDLAYLTQLWLELAGEAYWYIDKAGNIPTAIWPINPSRMTPVPGQAGGTFLLGWIYTDPNGQRIPLAAEDIIQLKYPNPMDIYRGLGPVQAALIDIQAARYTAEWNLNYFLNSAQPDGIVTVPTTLSDEDYTQLTNRWRESHQGVARAHSVAFLEAGAVWQATSTTLRDMDFANLRNVSEDLIRRAWGIHPQMIGNVADVNRANAITSMEIHYAEQTIPRVDLIKNTLNKKFLPMFGATGEGVEFDYASMQPPNREADMRELLSKAQSVQFLVAAGATLESAAAFAGVDVDPAPVPPPRPAAPAVPAVTTEDSSQSDNQDMTNRLRKVLMNGHKPVELEVCGIKTL